MLSHLAIFAIAFASCPWLCISGVHASASGSAFLLYVPHSTHMQVDELSSDVTICLPVGDETV